MTLKGDEAPCAWVVFTGRAAARSDISQAIQNLCERQTPASSFAPRKCEAIRSLKKKIHTFKFGFEKKNLFGAKEHISFCRGSFA